MNPKFLWPLGCVGALVIGWIGGYLMGGVPRADERPATAHAALFATPAGKITGHTRDDSPAATAEEEKRRMQAMLGALRDPNVIRGTRDMYDAILKMSPGEIPAAVALVQRLPKSERSQLLTPLVSRWAEADPRAAADFAISLDSYFRSSEVYSVARSWANADPQAAKEWALSLSPGDARSDALHSITMVMAVKDPEAALQFIQALPSGSPRPGAYWDIFATLAAKNPETAGARALALPAGLNRDDALRATVNRWTETNPQAALAWAAQIPEAGVRRDAVEGAYKEWVSQDAKAASAAALALPAGEERDRALATVISSLTSSDPRTTATLIEQMPDGEAREQAIASLAASWAFHDVLSALAWVEQLPDGKAKHYARDQLIFTWRISDPRAAADYFLKMMPPSSETAGERLGSLIGSWAKNDLQHAVEWTRQLTDEKVRATVLGEIIRDLAARDPQRAVGLLAELPAESQRFVAGNLARAWMRSDRNAAAAWALQLPEGDVRRDAMGAVAGEMATHDLAKTADWLEQLPLGGSRDQAVWVFVGHAAKSDPAIATVWAATITDEKLRNDETERAASKWLRQDRDSATRWITESNLLDEKTKKRLLPKN